MKRKTAKLAPLALLPLVALPWLTGAFSEDGRRQADRELVESIIRSFFILSEQGDWDGVGALLSDDFEIYTDQAVAIAKADYMALLKSEDMDLVDWRISDLTIHVSPDGQTAWCKYRGRFSSRTGGSLDLVETVETLIFGKESGQWQIKHGHASIKSLDPQTD